MNQQSEIFGLKELIDPFSINEFIERYWILNEWLHVESTLERFKDSPFLSQLSSPSSFVKLYSGRVSLIHKDRPLSFHCRAQEEAGAIPRWSFLNRLKAVGRQG